MNKKTLSFCTSKYEKARNAIAKKYMLPFQEKEHTNTPDTVGVELEFPLINLSKKQITPSLTNNLMQHLAQSPFQFQIQETDKNGNIVGVSNKTDLIAFDNSYNNIEFSMGNATSIHAIAERFYKYLSYIQAFLSSHNHAIVGQGTNPNRHHIGDNPVSIPIYDAIRGYLKFIVEKKQPHNANTSSKVIGEISCKAADNPPYEASCEAADETSYEAACKTICEMTNPTSSYHSCTYFPPYLSSVQTHVDIHYSQLCQKLNLFSELDFIRAILFSNSPSFQTCSQSFLCFRDYLWEKSGFSFNPHNVGKIDETFHTPDDIIDHYMQRSIFFREKCADRVQAAENPHTTLQQNTVPPEKTMYSEKMLHPENKFKTYDANQKYEYFTPVPLHQYFTEPQYQAIENDIFSFISFRTIELTFRGTLEIRSDCAQPLPEAFAPAAFNFGLSKNAEKALHCIRTFKQKNGISLSNSALRNLAITDILMPEVRHKMTESTLAVSNMQTKIPNVSVLALQACILELLDIAKAGLQLSNPADIQYLLPLYKRGTMLQCPCLVLLPPDSTHKKCNGKT